jgi:hypothetical protein
MQGTVYLDNADDDGHTRAEKNSKERGQCVLDRGRAGDSFMNVDIGRESGRRVCTNETARVKAVGGGTTEEQHSTKLAL